MFFIKFANGIKHINKKSMKHTFFLFAIALLTSIVACTSQETAKLDEIDELVTNNQNEEALKRLDAYIDKHPTSADALFLRAQAHLNLDMPENAATDVESAIANWREDCKYKKSRILLWKGAMNIYVGNYQSAVDCYNTLYDLIAENDADSIMPNVLYGRADAYHYLGDYVNADIDYIMLANYEGWEIDAGIGLARNAMMRGECEKALALFDEIIEHDITNSKALFCRMQLYDKMGRTIKAIDDAMLFLQASLDYEDEYILSVFCKDLPYSISKIEQYELLTGAKIPGLRNLLVMLCMDNKEYKYALTVLKTYEEDFGAIPPMYYYRSLCYRELGLYKKAVSEIDKAIGALIPNDEENRLFLLISKAECFKYMGRYNDAIELLGPLEGSESPYTSFYYYLRGWCYELMGNDEAAMKDYNKGIESGENYAYTYLMRGEQYLKRGETAKAQADFEQVLALDTIPEEGSCRQYALHFTGNDKEALQWMDKVLETTGYDCGSYYDKACLLAHMGRNDEAVAALATALERGFRTFAHIENDNDMDPIRERSDFKQLIEKYKALPLAE